MSSQQRTFHLLVLFLSVFSTFPPLSSSADQWKNPSTKGSKSPIYGSGDRHSMPTDAPIRSPVKPEHDAGTSEPPDKPEVDGISAAELLSDRNEFAVRKEGTVGQFEPALELQWWKVGESGRFGAGDDENSGWEREKRKWGQNSMSVWGKRESGDQERRKWSENRIGVWGKRASDGSKEKRKWGENTMSVWGKRGDDEDDEREKRKWGENTMSVWGKRFLDGRERISKDENSDTVHTGNKPEMIRDTEKKSGSNSHPRRLRKRSAYDDDGSSEGGDWYDDLDLSKGSQPPGRSFPRPYDGPKRSWETNTMKVWGKRSDPTRGDYPYDMEPGDEKRKWTSDNAIRIWGKREIVPPLPYHHEDRVLNRNYDFYEN